MLKTTVCKIEDYIEKRKKENKGQASKLIGADGFKMDLTIENYNKLKKFCLKRYEEEVNKNRKKAS